MTAEAEPPGTEATATGPPGAPADVPAAGEEVDQRRSLMQAFGGGRGLLDTSLPGLVFVLAFVVLHAVRLSAAVAVAVGVVLLVVRLARRETTQYAISGFVGVVIAALIAAATGTAKNYFLPGILKNLGFAVLYLASVLVRWPLLGIVLGPLLKENLAWRHHDARRRAYAQASLLWAAMFALRLGIMLPLYLLDQTVALGVSGVVLGWPVFGAVLWGTWLCLRRVPPVRVG